MSNVLPLFVSPFPLRAAARAERIAAENLATETILLVAMRERRIERLLEALRRERDGLASDKAKATEAERLYCRAADRYRAVHRPARPWSESASDEGSKAA